MRALRVLLVLAGTVLLGIATPSGARAQRVQTGTSLNADTVRIGDPFLLSVRVRAPLGSTITFPEPPDTAAGPVQGLDPKLVRKAPDSSAVDQTAIYRLAAWDIGNQPIKLGEIVVKTPTGEQRVSAGHLAVFVASVLPADSSKRVPKPPRPLMRFPQPLWWLYALVAAALILLGLAWWWWRRRHRRQAAAARSVDPFTFAEREFDRLERLGLVEAGERGRFVSVAAEIVRQYLAMRYDRASLALTSDELSRALRDERTIPHDRLARFLEEVDLVKFARRPVSQERARELAREARGIVREEHELSTPLPAPETEKAA